jgi:ABC-type protease/lipase transport system fused ATPase/permease subunit
VCDKVLVLRDGVQRAFGPRDEVMRQMMPQPGPPTPPAAAAPTAMSGTLRMVADTPGGGTR